MSGSQILGLIAIVMAGVTAITCVVLKSIEDIIWRSQWLRKQEPLKWDHIDEEDDNNGKE